jgi:hypothetical protein
MSKYERHVQMGRKALFFHMTLTDDMSLVIKHSYQLPKQINGQFLLDHMKPKVQRQLNNINSVNKKLINIHYMSVSVTESFVGL